MVNKITFNKKAHGLSEDLYTPSNQRKEREEEFWDLIKKLKDETKFGDKVVADKYKVKEGFDKFIKNDKTNPDKKY